MTDSELLALAIQMRAAQIAYYQSRHAHGGDVRAQLRDALALERRFDQAVAERDSPERTRSLFDAYPLDPRD